MVETIKIERRLVVARGPGRGTDWELLFNGFGLSVL